MIRKSKSFELLSAYIDNELSYEENVQLEEIIKSSLPLQKKLKDLKKIKQLTASAYNILPESSYFETRLFTALATREPWYKKLLKWSPAIGLAFATVIIMAVLKFNPDIFENLIEQQKSNNAGLYKDNLQPLLIAANINKEDIFNFAMYKKLPLDKDDKQVIQIGYDETGKEYFEIKKLEARHSENNFEKFVLALNLDEKEIKQIDSIMNQYAEELEARILVNENSTVAINYNLWSYQRAIQADLLAFAEKSNWQQFQKFVPNTAAYNNNSDVVLAVNEMRNSRNQNYIFLTPDSIFSEPMKFNLRITRLKKELNKQKKNLREIQFQFEYDSSLQKLGNKMHNNFKISFDTNLCRVEISKFDIPDMNPHNFDSIFTVFDSVANNFKFFSQFIPKIEYFDDKVQFHFDGDSLKTYEFEYYKFDLDSLIDFHSGKFDSIKGGIWNKFYNFNDTLVGNEIPNLDRYFKSYEGDVEIQLEMKKLRKELNKFREEMRQWKEELRREFRSQFKKENN